MEVVRLASMEPCGWPSAVVAVGNFDGVHRGHQALVAATCEAARTLAGKAVVLTFDPPPARVVSPENAPRALMTLDQKAETLAALEVDVLAVLPFTPERSRDRPQAFARGVLQRALLARRVVVGTNFRFGRDRSGDLLVLQRLGRDLGFEVQGLPPVLEGGRPVSSTRIREAVGQGAVDEAGRLLGRAFFIDGRVVRGDGRGRTIGVPTANVEPENEMIPGRGVYAARCRVPGGGVFPAVVNVGERPTFGAGRTTVEAHLLDFQGDLYGGRVRLVFEVRLREERAFPAVEALVAQIGRDIAEARRHLAGERQDGSDGL
jgi:riboflavin kinase / FMN adenylyltransferase